MNILCSPCWVSADGPEFQESFVASGVFSVAELVQVSRSKLVLPSAAISFSSFFHSLNSVSSLPLVPVVTGVAPGFSMGDLQGHLAYDLNQSINQPVSLKRSLASTSSSGYVLSKHSSTFTALCLTVSGSGHLLCSHYVSKLRQYVTVTWHSH